jgi:predicted ester cyclase
LPQRIRSDLRRPHHKLEHLRDAEEIALEAEFVGTHIAEFAGPPASGKKIRVPYSVVYDLEGKQIAALRIYGLAEGIIRQLEN